MALSASTSPPQQCQKPKETYRQIPLDKTPKTSCTTLSQIVENEHKASSTEFVKTNPLVSSPLSPVDFAPIVVPHEEQQHSLVQAILPPPEQFQCASVISDCSDNPFGDRSSNSELQVTYDLMTNNSELRYMDESSIMLPSPITNDASQSSSYQFQINQSKQLTLGKSQVPALHVPTKLLPVPLY
ncbi:hypothetical protein EVAR_70673_1 [Eumeta japonica]|uniref:Uncharacterized protein n=1 Tax=Eumeta variegata TaxID=151549 RepID=A0A4C1SV49_EUMVA|nr:hypothetical protein EVAR_70673_1 [Eumeta japonica]